MESDSERPRAPLPGKRIEQGLLPVLCSHFPPWQWLKKR